MISQSMTLEEILGGEIECPVVAVEPETLEGLAKEPSDPSFRRIPLTEPVRYGWEDWKRERMLRNQLPRICDCDPDELEYVTVIESTTLRRKLLCHCRRCGVQYNTIIPEELACFSDVDLREWMTVDNVRRIDEIGRIVIPKDLRNYLNINEGDAFDIWVQNGCIVLRKNDPNQVFV